MLILFLGTLFSSCIVDIKLNQTSVIPTFIRYGVNNLEVLKEIKAFKIQALVINLSAQFSP